MRRLLISIVRELSNLKPPSFLKTSQTPNPLEYPYNTFLGNLYGTLIGMLLGTCIGSTKNPSNPRFRVAEDYEEDEKPLPEDLGEMAPPIPKEDD